MHFLSCLQDVKLLTEDLGELKPTVFCAVPRVLDRIYSGNILPSRTIDSYKVSNFSIQSLMLTSFSNENLCSTGVPMYYRCDLRRKCVDIKLIIEEFFSLYNNHV